MPIEFRCSQCDQLLRVPETAAGKHARCPRCQALMAVPGVATAVALPVESQPPDLPTPQTPPPSSQPASFSGPNNPFAGEPGVQPQPASWAGSATPGPFPTALPPDSLNPYAAPAATAGYGYSPYYPRGPRAGLPWENEPRSIGCWFRTMSTVLGSPENAFTMMRQYGGLGGPLLYNLYSVGMIMTLVALIVVPILALVGVFGAGNNNNGGAMVLGVAAVAGAVIVMTLFYAVILVVVVPLVWAAVTHVSLMVVGGAKHGFETTFRVICFGYFSLLPPSMFLNLVPYLGGLAVMIWTVVVLVYGISRAHEISGGKATAAVLLPVGVCCGLGLIIMIVGFSLDAWQ
jgi:hypothetical protein